MRKSASQQNIKPIQLVITVDTQRHVAKLDSVLLLSSATCSRPYYKQPVIDSRRVSNTTRTYQIYGNRVLVNIKRERERER